MGLVSKPRLQYLVLSFLAGLMVNCDVPSSLLLIPKPDHSKPPVEEKLGDVSLTFSPKVDILMVVDDSGSMGVHQSNLSRNIELFTKAMEANPLLDYHIGVVTTTTTKWSTRPCCGKLVGSTKFVTRDTLDGRNILARNLLVGTDGSFEEMVFEPTILALTAPLVNGENSGFYRKDAFLAAVFITDAEDQSDYAPTQALNILQSLKARPSMFVSYGVISPTQDSSCRRDEASSPAWRIEEFVKRSGGFTFSLCDPDFGDRLAHVADDLVGRVSRWLPLRYPPVVSTIRVQYGQQVIPMDLDKGWWYDSQRVALVLAKGLELDQDQVDPQLIVNFVPADL